MIDAIKLNKSNDNRIKVTLLVDDVETANKLYLKAVETNTEVQVDDDVLMAFSKSNEALEKQNKFDELIKSKKKRKGD
ncbi:hypothetical protein [Serratia odorifera]|uniref:hypothetical protein n=1 Tax=Serratia odorifera TaxID=618 RepID=UPI0018E711C8|nr:hypothetical protein [Serratia odorifera]MBJ2065667.1 hypothetical protein [Serratia odorifera]